VELIDTNFVLSEVD